MQAEFKMLGLKKGAVVLVEYRKEWETEAQKIILKLKELLGNIIKDIEHIGSTSIPSIKAKPIIDIAVLVDSFDDVLTYEQKMRENGFFYIPHNKTDNQLLFARGSFYEKNGDLQTHFIHIVKSDSSEFVNYINFRDYLRNNFSVAKQYEALKISLAEKYSGDNCRENYTEGKHNFIVSVLKKVDETNFYDVKDEIENFHIAQLLAPSVYKPTKDKLINRAKKYKEDKNICIYAYKDTGMYKGIIVFKVKDDVATILDFAVKPEYQRKGIGTKFIDFIADKFGIEKIVAETDDDAVGFYRKYGFSVSSAETEFDIDRYICEFPVVKNEFAEAKTDKA